MNVRVTIDALAFGGDGVARLPSGKVLFVPGTLPGETVEVEIVEEKKSLARGRLTGIIQAHDGRRPPECPLAERCGGCHFGSVSYALEWELKSQVALETLTRTGKIALPDSVERVAASSDRGYRRRVRLQIVKGALGFFEAGSHRIVGYRACLVAHPTLLRAASEVERGLEAVARGDMLLELDGDDHAVALISPRTDGGAVRRWLNAHHRDLVILTGVRVLGAHPRQPARDFGDVRFTVGVDGDHYELEVGAFTQANPHTNTLLVGSVVEHLAATEGDRVLELYCGFGNFTFPVAKTGASVTAFDMGPESLTGAERASAKHPELAVRFHARDLSRGLTTRWRKPGGFDKVLLDPPRRGAKEVLSALGEIGPSRIVYVSCDPPSLGRDLGTLIRAHGYRLDALVLFDMFPRTFHVETLAQLSRTHP